MHSLTQLVGHRDGHADEYTRAERVQQRVRQQGQVPSSRGRALPRGQW